MPDYGSPDGVEAAAEPLPEVDDYQADGTPASLPTEGFGDMGAGQARSVSDLARQADDRPEVPELMDSPKTDVIDATDDYPAEDFAEVDEEPAEMAAAHPREAQDPPIDWEARDLRRNALNVAAQNNHGRSLRAEDMIDEASAYVDFIKHGIGC